ncbi:DUF1877 family protein [Kitasatospora camelliae]|uniref:DUF1877 family protein n=1 Tax=Kitasatospora camelliae TaxID=3156397 RepID=A0AAU8JPV7_9ACTN
MALTQQLARVSPEYLARCRRNAEDAPDGDPGWDPPAEDALDLNWAIWGLERYLRRVAADPVLVGAVERSCEGTEVLRFLDHETVYDGFGDPPALLAPEAVAEVSRLLDAVDVDAMLARLPGDTEEAARMCGFDGFHGDLTAYLRGQFTALRDFHRGAADRGLAVVTWID